MGFGMERETRYGKRGDHARVDYFLYLLFNVGMPLFFLCMAIWGSDLGASTLMVFGVPYSIGLCAVASSSREALVFLLPPIVLFAPYAQFSDPHVRIVLGTVLIGSVVLVHCARGWLMIFKQGDRYLP